MAEGVRVRPTSQSGRRVENLREGAGRFVAVPEHLILPGRDALGRSGVLCGANVGAGVARFGGHDIAPARSCGYRPDWIGIQDNKLAGAQMERIVITGMGTVNPLGMGVAETWKNAVAGVSGVGSHHAI